MAERLHDEVLALLGTAKAVELSELLRRENHDFQTQLKHLREERRYTAPDPRTTGELWTTLRPVLERRLALLFPLALHDPPRFQAEIAAVVRQLECRRVMSGYDHYWAQAEEFGVAWLGYMTGALLVRHERWPTLSPLLSGTWSTEDGYAKPVVDLTGDLAYELGSSLAPTGHTWLSATWEFIAASLTPLSWVSARYPELFIEGEPRSSLVQFDLLLCLAHGGVGRDSMAFFTLAGDDRSHIKLATRLYRDKPTRDAVAAATGLPAGTFADAARTALQHAERFRGGFTTDPQRIADIIQTGASPR